MKIGKYEKENQVIQGVVGDGLTVFGSHKMSYQRHMVRQMAEAVARGEPLFDTLPVKQGRVLIFHNDKADGYLMAESLSDTDGILLYSYYGEFKVNDSDHPLRNRTQFRHRRLRSGLCQAVTKEKEENADLALVIMFQFAQLKQSLENWLEESPERLSQVPEALVDASTRASWGRERDITSVNHLRSLSAEIDTPIILCEPLTTKNKFFNHPSLTYFPDNFLYLTSSYNAWSLEVRDSEYVQSETYNLIYDGAFYLEEPLPAQQETFEADEQVLAVLRRGPDQGMSVVELEDATGTKANTLSNRVLARLMKKNLIRRVKHANKYLYTAT